VRPVLIISFTASSLYSGVNPPRVRPMMNILSYEVSTERSQGQTFLREATTPATRASLEGNSASCPSSLDG
jgi:hypothetical protein